MFRIGCLSQLVLMVVATVVSHFLIGYSLSIWFGGEVLARWEQVNIFVQYLVALVTSSVTIPVGIVSFFAQLIAAETPIF